MAAINDLIAQIQDPILRAKIEQEANKLSKQKKFGLVFEEHLPESTRLYGVPIRKGSMVTLKNDKGGQTFVVLRKTGDTAVCLPRDGGETVMHPLSDLVMVAEFGEPIYPYLEPLDSVCNAPDSDLWHTLIEADNYHALQLLEYLYAGKVDCIYIDPPYNTGAKDWKYNNDYVDGADTYRHSKWLSFIEGNQSIHIFISEIFKDRICQPVALSINNAPFAIRPTANVRHEYLIGVVEVLDLIKDKGNYFIARTVNWMLCFCSRILPAVLLPVDQPNFRKQHLRFGPEREYSSGRSAAAF